MRLSERKYFLNENQLLMLGLTLPFEKSGISGQKIEQLIEERDIRQWTNIGFSSIYYLLDWLEKKKFLDSTKGDRNGRGAPYKLYFINQNGKKALKKAIEQYLSSKIDFKTFMTVLSVFPVLTYKEALQHLKNYQKLLINWSKGKVKQKFEKINNDRLPIHIWAIFNYSFYLTNAEIKFLEELINKYQLALKGKNSPYKHLVDGKYL